MENKKTNYGKIIAIIVGVIIGLTAAAFFVSKLLQKYFVLKDTEYDDLMEGNEDEASDIVLDHADEEEAEEAQSDAE